MVEFLIRNEGVVIWWCSVLEDAGHHAGGVDCGWIDVCCCFPILSELVGSENTAQCVLENLDNVIEFLLDFSLGHVLMSLQLRSIVTTHNTAHAQCAPQERSSKDEGKTPKERSISGSNPNRKLPTAASKRRKDRVSAATSSGPPGSSSSSKVPAGYSAQQAAVNDMMRRALAEDQYSALGEIRVIHSVACALVTIYPGLSLTLLVHALIK